MGGRDWNDEWHLLGGLWGQLRQVVTMVQCEAPQWWLSWFRFAPVTIVRYLRTINHSEIGVMFTNWTLSNGGLTFYSNSWMVKNSNPSDDVWYHGVVSWIGHLQLRKNEVTTAWCMAVQWWWDSSTYKPAIKTESPAPCFVALTWEELVGRSRG